MDDTAPSARDDDALQATATRLVEALGIEDAVFVCRSNYWYGVLRLIMDRQAGDLDRDPAVREQRPAGPVPDYDLAA